MYKIKNITVGVVFLGDLSNLKLSQNEVIDLDSRFSRNAIDNSRDLENAKERKLIDVLHKDVLVKLKDISPTPAPAQSTETPATAPIDATIIAEMVRKTLLDMGIGEKDSQKDLAHDKLDAILAALGNTQARSDILQKTDDSIGQVDADTSIDIQARLIKRLSNNVEASVEAKTETKESADLQKNADDLEKILDGCE